MPGGEQHNEPVQLEAIGDNVWWLSRFDGPGRVVEADRGSGEIIREIWVETLTDGFLSGNTLVCDNSEAEVQLISLYWEFRGPTNETLYLRHTLDGELLGEREVVVDGASSPEDIHRVCGAFRFPFIRITALQLGALLNVAGFSDIGGDHAIDPVWEASGKWEGTEYWPINLYQGDFRPDPNQHTELLECRMGGLELTTDLPANARTALSRTAGC